MPNIEYFKNRICSGDCKIILTKIPDNSIDAIVTDPPYELSFMNKGWDGTGIAYDIEMWKECLRVLKPGGHLLSFGGTRTYHRMACAIEDAGFEIRDNIVELLSTDTAVVNFLESLSQAQVEAFLRVMEESQFGGTIEWVYGSGFPKSINISKAIDKSMGTEKIIGKGRAGKTALGQSSDWNKTYNPHEYNITEANSPDAKKWDGFGSSLKPAHEPIVLARKPLSEKTIVANVLKWGTGGIAIDDCRIEHNEDVKTTNRQKDKGDIWNKDSCGLRSNPTNIASANPQGRFPANIIHDGSEELVREFPDSKSTGGRTVTRSGGGAVGSGKASEKEWSNDNPGYGDSGSASRFFYCAKASKSERNIGLLNKDEVTVDDGRQKTIDNPFQRGKTLRKNNHPTVKPIKLIEYLVKLISKEDDIVLDPFFGSGTTGIACVNLNRNFVGIEEEEEYAEIAKARIDYLKNDKEG